MEFKILKRDQNRENQELMELVDKQPEISHRLKLFRMEDSKEAEASLMQLKSQANRSIWQVAKTITVVLMAMTQMAATNQELKQVSLRMMMKSWDSSIRWLMT